MKVLLIALFIIGLVFYILYHQFYLYKHCIFYHINTLLAL